MRAACPRHLRLASHQLNPPHTRSWAWTHTLFPTHSQAVSVEDLEDLFPLLPAKSYSNWALAKIDNNMIWYDMIWYDMIWYDMIWHDMIDSSQSGSDTRSPDLCQVWDLSPITDPIFRGVLRTKLLQLLTAQMLEFSDLSHRLGTELTYWLPEKQSQSWQYLKRTICNMYHACISNPMTIE